MDYILPRGPSDVEIAWFAGFFDGEGCIHIAFKKTNPNCLRKSFQLHISVSSTHIPTINKVKTMWNFGSVCIIATKNRQYKPYAYWRTVSVKAASVLRLCLPYLSVKKEEAEIAIAFQETKSRNAKLFGHKYQPTDILNRGEEFRNLLINLPTRKNVPSNYQLSIN